MSTSKATVPSPLAETLIQLKSATSTPALNVTGSAGGGGADEKIYIVQVNNTLNTTTCYTKIYNANAVTAGETVPDVVLPCPGGATIEYVLLEGIPMAEGGGGAPSKGISTITVVEPGTGGNTSPTGAVGVRLLIDT